MRRIDNGLRSALALLLCVLVLTSSVAFAKPAAETKLTRQAVAEIILAAADDYNTTATLKSVTDSIGDLSQAATKAEAYAMIRRGFGKLPAPVGNNLRLFNFDDPYADTPDWAKNDIDALRKAGVLVGKDDGTLGANESVSESELRAVIARLYRLFGTNPKDDFFTAVNKKGLDTAVFRAGYVTAGTTADVEFATTKQLQSALDGLLKGKHQKGSKEQFVATFYGNALNMANRNAQGVKPLEPYLARIDAVQSFSELMSMNIACANELGVSPLISLGIDVDPKDSGKCVPVLEYTYPALSKDMYASGEYKQSVIEYYQVLLRLGGESESAATASAGAIYAMSEDIASVMLSPQELYDVDKVYKATTIGAMDKLFKNVDLRQIAKEIGFQIADTDKLLCFDYRAAVKAEKYFSDKYLELMKSRMKLVLISAFSGVLSQDFIDAGNRYNAALYGVEEPTPARERALQMTLGVLSDYAGQIYVEKFVSPKTKADVEAMISEFIGVYAQRIRNLDWMSAKTKVMALKKLSTLNVKVGYPNKWNDFLKGYEIKTFGEGGSLFDNLRQVYIASHQEMIAQQKLPVNRDEWSMSVYEVNAYYNPSLNEIVFPAGILQPPYYDETASKEANLGAIGAIIAHEISHAFDNSGSKYDENGNARNWWTKQDYANFRKQCAGVEAFFDGREIMPGVLSDGTLTLGENIADLGGLSCAIEVMRKIPGYDAKKFFEAYAVSWMDISTKEFILYLAKSDSHSDPYLRVNRALQCYEEFFQAYGISEGDGMYLPPEQRVSVW